MTVKKALAKVPMLGLLGAASLVWLLPYGEVQEAGIQFGPDN